MGFGSMVKDVGNSLIGNNKKATIRIGVKKTSDHEVDINDYQFSMKVQYNPSSLRLSTSAGYTRQSNVGGEGMNTVTQLNQPPQTNLSIKLIFDKVQPADAFMFSKVNNLSVSGVAQTIGSFIKKDRFSVQDQVEALVACVMLPEYRYAQFCWNEMAYEGEITACDVNYTMFNPKGNPVRAEVNITLQQNQDAIGGDLDYWTKSFDSIFKVGAGAGDSSFSAVDPTSILGNLLNI